MAYLLKIKTAPILLILFLGFSHWSCGQTSPQLSNNLFVGLSIDEHWRLGNELAYDFLYLYPSVWNESSIASTGTRSFGKMIEATAGIRFSRTQQDEVLSNRELRPTLGFRIFSRPDKRYRIGNYTPGLSSAI